MDIPAQNSGAFIPSTYTFDISQIYSTDSKSPEFKELIVKLYQYLNQIALSVNIRDAGYYVTDEFVNGQLYYINPDLNSNSSTSPAFRQVYRKVINFGALPNAGTTSIAHNIEVNASYTFTRIYATATNPNAVDPAIFSIPIPYVSLAAENIELNVTSKFVTIITESNRSMLTKCNVVLEYIKS